MELVTHQLFPTEVFEIKLPEKLIDSCRAELDEHYNKNLDNSFHSIYYTDYQKQGILELGESTKLLTQMVEKYTTQAFKERYTVTHSWVNYVQKHRVHSQHRHGDYNHASAIVYFDNVGQTNFFDPRVQVYNEKEWISKAEKGKLVIFPAWLMHEMPHHEEDDFLRVTMPFNLQRKRLRNEFK
jgi:hypothetical protein